MTRQVCPILATHRALLLTYVWCVEWVYGLEAGR